MTYGNKSNDQGSAAVMVAVSLLLLLGFSALAIDAGLGFDERRDAQNAADNAAYAAAYEACNPKDAGSPDPVAVGTAMAAKNGFDDSQPNTSVEVTASGAGWHVAITQTTDTNFGPATPYAQDSVTVFAEATAICESNPFLGGYAVFSGATDCPQYEMNLSGDDIHIVGDVHANEALSITGSSPVIDGAITYGDGPGATAHGAGAAGATSVPFQDYPLDPNIINDFRPGGVHSSEPNYVAFVAPNLDNNVTNDDLLAALGADATGNQTSMTVTGQYIIYAPGDIDLKGFSTSGGGEITLVAEGEISIVANGDVTGHALVEEGNYGTRLTAFSWNVDPTNCAPGPASAVSVSTSDFAWNGLIFAPNGLVSFSAGNAAAEVNGSIIAFMINLSGSNLTLQYDDSANADPEFILDLLD